MNKVRALLACAVVALGACGDGDDDDAMDTSGDMDSSGNDGGADGSSAEDDCAEFCEAMAPLCPTEFTATWADQAACATDCLAVSGTVQACWIKHLGFAASAPMGQDRIYHCRHAVGDPDPQAETPAACLR